MLVNVPPVFRFAWRAIKPLIDSRSADRVFMLGADWRAKVSEYVDDDNLPAALGGRMREEWPCEFGEAWPETGPEAEHLKVA